MMLELGRDVVTPFPYLMADNESTSFARSSAQAFTGQRQLESSYFSVKRCFPKRQQACNKHVTSLLHDEK